MASGINWQALKMTREGRIPMAKWNAMIDILAKITLVDLIGGTFEMTVAGLKMVIKAGFGGGAESSHPWKVFARVNPDDESGLTFQAKVELESDVLKSGKATDFLVVTGLDDWFDLVADDLIWIEIPIAAGYYYPSGDATIKSYGQGNGELDPGADPWTDSGYISAADNEDTESPQNVLRVPLAQFFPDDAGKPSGRQLAFAHLMLSYFPAGIDGRPAVVANPSPYGRYVTG